MDESSIESGGLLKKQVIKPNDFDRAKNSISKLRLLSPLRMRRIDQIKEERTYILNTLREDDKKNFLGADRFATMLSFIGTEGRIVEEIFVGFTRESRFTRGLWGEVLVGILGSVEEGRRTQYYGELLDAAKTTKDQSKKRAIEDILKKLDAIDPEARQRAENEDYFKSNMLNIQSIMLEDTFKNMF